MTFFTKMKVEKSIYSLPTKYSKLNATDRYLVRHEYELKQKYLCYCCNGSLKFGPPEHIRMKKIDPGLFPNGFFDNPVHLHHDHNTDLTIGAVHAYCNAILWEYHHE